MLKTISKNAFDVVAGLTMIAAVFYLAAITHIVPVPESVLKRLGEISVNIMDGLAVCISWLANIFP
jgi:hypothetical protein